MGGRAGMFDGRKKSMREGGFVGGWEGGLV